MACRKGEVPGSKKKDPLHWAERGRDMADLGNDKGSKTYSLYTSIRRYFEPLKEHWQKLTPEEQAVVITEVEAFLNSVRPTRS